MGLDPTPFTQLHQPRRIETDWLPRDLREFYATREGVGLGSTPDRCVRLCKLAEVTPIRWADLHSFGRDEPDGGWKEFSAIRLGVSSFFDELVWVLSAPSALAGSVMTFGVDVAEPGGTGKETIEGSLVLSEDFNHWIARLAHDGWTDYGLVPGEINQHVGSAGTPADRSFCRRFNGPQEYLRTLLFIPDFSRPG